MVAEAQTAKGYKMTEVGEIPVDWEIVNIGDLCSITTGAKDTQDRVETGLYPFFVRSDTVERINSFSFDEEAILTSGDGVGVGKIFHHIIGKFDFHQRVYCLYNYNDVYGRYLYLQFSSRFYDRIMSMTAKSSVDSVRMEMISKMPIPLPPTLAEQKAIATALSDVDGYITKLDELIAKKKLIKQGAMQELLTGKKRLPGFDGDWEEKRLGELLQYEQPTAYIVESSEYSQYAQTPVLTAGKSFILGRTDETEGIFSKTPVIIFDDFTTSVHIPMKLTTLNRSKLTSQSGGEKVSFLAAVIIQI